jgi:hypothetical protein
MQSDDLTPALAQRIRQSIRPMMTYLLRLKQRMEKRRFPLDDELLQAVFRLPSYRLYSGTAVVAPNSAFHNVAPALVDPGDFVGGHFGRHP